MLTFQATLQRHPAANLPSYRLRLRPYEQACEMDSTLDGFIQVKARNAAEAMQLGRATVSEKLIVIEAERLDG